MFAQSLEAKIQEESGDKIASENDDMIGHNVEVQEIFFAKIQEESGDKIASENDDMIGHNVEVQEIFFFVFKIYELIIHASF